MVEESLFSPDTHIAEAGRAILANELSTIQAHYGALLDEAEVTAVHETRKAIRRTFTAVKLFDPFFEPGVLKAHRRRLRKIMHRLARCRDIAVFLLKMTTFEETNRVLPGLRQSWHDRKLEADDTLQRYLKKPKRRIFMEEYEEFTRSAGLAVKDDASCQIVPIKVRHLASWLIQRRISEVRAFDEYLANPTLDRMHKLRIRCKDLHYTLGFFSPVLGPEIQTARITVKEILDLLGNLNDAKVAVRLLDNTPDLDEEVSVFRVAKEDEINRLIDSFPQAWKRFDSSSWRRHLGRAMAVL